MEGSYTSGLGRLGHRTIYLYTTMGEAGVRAAEANVKGRPVVLTEKLCRIVPERRDGFLEVIDCNWNEP